jgi:hypothetical protein
MRLRNIMEDPVTEKAHITVDGRCSASDKSPGLGIVVWEGGIVVLEVCYCDYSKVNLSFEIG